MSSANQAAINDYYIYQYVTKPQRASSLKGSYIVGVNDGIKDIVGNSGLASYANWDDPYKLYAHTPFEGITEYSISWYHGGTSATSISLYEGSKESMEARADDFGREADFWGSFGFIESIASFSSLAAGKLGMTIPPILDSTTEFMGASVLFAIEPAFTAGMSWKASNAKDYIIDQTYF